MNKKVINTLFGGISLLMIAGCSQDPVSLNNENSTPEYFASTNQFGNRTSTFNGVEIKIFETNPLTQGVDVAVYTDKKTINNTSLLGLNDQQIKAKINCSFMEDRSSSGDAFYGINYTRQNLYINGKQLNGTTDSRLAVLNSDNQFYPSFCIRNDWSTAIRWPRHDDGTQNANYCIPATVKACRTIIGSGHALIYEGKNVFTQSQPVNDNQGYPIYISDYAKNDRFNHIIGEPFNTTTRTLFGQKSDNSFLMVVVEKPGLTVKECAKLMATLGCVNAVNFDGGGSSLMTVKGSKVTSSGSTGSYYGTVVMAYSKYGDVNDDGSTNAIDFAVMRQYLLGINNLANNVRSDVDGDGSVNSIDFAVMRQYLLGSINKFPADK